MEHKEEEKIIELDDSKLISEKSLSVIPNKDLPYETTNGIIGVSSFQNINLIGLSSTTYPGDKYVLDTDHLDQAVYELARVGGVIAVRPKISGSYRLHFQSYCYAIAASRVAIFLLQLPGNIQKSYSVESFGNKESRRIAFTRILKCTGNEWFYVAARQVLQSGNLRLAMGEGMPTNPDASLRHSSLYLQKV